MLFIPKRAYFSVQEDGNPDYSHGRIKSFSSCPQLTALGAAASTALTSGAQTFCLVGHICLSETLRGPQELIISIQIL